MNSQIPHFEELQVLLEDKFFKRRLVLWSHYIKGKSKAAVAEDTEIPPSTVKDIIKKWKDYGVIDDLPRKGRPKEYNIEEEKMVVELQETDRFLPATTIQKEMQEQGHLLSYKQTLGIINTNFESVYAPYKIDLQAFHKTQRIEWCNSHLEWRTWKWNNIVWTDEKVFRLCPTGKKAIVKIHFDENVDQFSLPLKQQGGEGIMFWGAISSKGKIYFDALYGDIDSKAYSQFLKEHALPQITRTHGNNFILQQDNAPPHRGLTTQLLKEKSIQTLPWPPSSPDLNPIEQVWLWMALKLKPELIKTIAILKARVFELWEEIPKDVILSYVNRIPDKAKWVSSNNGDLYPDKLSEI